MCTLIGYGIIFFTPMEILLPYPYTEGFPTRYPPFLFYPHFFLLEIGNGAALYNIRGVTPNDPMSYTLAYGINFLVIEFLICPPSSIWLLTKSLRYIMA